MTMATYNESKRRQLRANAKKSAKASHPSAPEHVARAAEAAASSAQLRAGTAAFPTNPGGCRPSSGGSTLRVEATGSEFRNHVNLGGTGERN